MPAFTHAAMLSVINSPWIKADSALGTTRGGSCLSWNALAPSSRSLMAFPPLATWCLVHLPAMLATLSLSMSTLTLVEIDEDRGEEGKVAKKSGPGRVL